MTRSTAGAALAGLAAGALITLLLWAWSADHLPWVSAESQPEYGTDTSTRRAVLQTIRHRRTVRRYAPDPVPRDDLVAILDAARYAPTAGNQQPWKFLVVQSRATLDRLKDHALTWYTERIRQSGEVRAQELETVRARVKEALDGALSAPVYVAVLVDTEASYPSYVVHDGTLAAGTLMIAARALGYGTGFFTSFFPDRQMKQFFGIPDRYSLICFTPIGVPDAWPETPPKKELADLVVYESFGRS